MVAAIVAGLTALAAIANLVMKFWPNRKDKILDDLEKQRKDTDKAIDDWAHSPPS